ncbi:MAG: pyridoxal phosphate-dependent aminotransferase [Bacteroidota bacterium]
MPSLSLRSQQIPASPIRKLVPFADAAKKRGTHVYHLNIGQPDLATPPAFWEAIQAAHPDVIAYTHSAGIMPLRESILQYYAHLGHSLSLPEIMVTTGASEALNFVFATCLNPGDEIIIPEPFYANYTAFSVFSNVKVVPIRTRIEDNFALPPIEEFEKLISPRTKAILICNPGNPTGVLYPKSSLEKLAEIVRRHDLFLIADEVYREFAYGGQKHHSILELKGMEELAIVIDSVSKRFSACGARIGSIVSRNTALMAGVLKLGQARLSSPLLAQIGTASLYELPQSYYEEVRHEYEERRNVLIEELRKIPGVFVPEISGAFYAMVQLPIDHSESFCQWMLKSFSYEGATVMTAPGAGFYASPDMGKDQVRIAYVLQKEDLRKAVRCLAEGLTVYPGKKVLSKIKN